MNFWTAFLLLLLALFYFTGQGQDLKTLRVARVNGTPPDIDGRINEKVWELVKWSGEFTQREPYDNQAPSQQTAVKVLYDDVNLYVAVRAFDSIPHKIEKRLSRRDNFEGDWVAVAIDSYDDDLTAFSFSVNAAGVKSDGMVTNDNEWDDTWNPVYYVKSQIDEYGWTAEFKIPLNQLRFAEIQNHEWGFQVLRYIFRKEETSLWQHIPRESSRWVSLFGSLEGINNINPKREVELIPYVSGNLEVEEGDEEDPFSNAQTWGYNAGLDGKVAVTSDLTLNYTINPDFGQVEADPSVVNLTAYEIFFEERRPFFIEGSNIFNYPLSIGGGPTRRDNLFYSRRIGRRPHYDPDLENGQFTKVPEFSRILGAMKLSGKTRSGWSVGIMEALTNREVVEIDDNGERSSRDAEPMTNFFNARIQKDFDRGNTVVGGMFTVTNRFINDTTIDFLTKAAYTGGLDFIKFWKEKAYYLATKVVLSHVSGSTEAITELQEAPRRYFQRPDAKHLNIDTSLTTLMGNGGSIEGGKIGKGNWRYGARINWRSPGLELNDMGFLRAADLVHQSSWLEYLVFQPFGIFRRMEVSLAQWSGWDYGANYLYGGLRLRGEAQFINYFNAGTGIRRETEEVMRVELFGGPAIRFPGSWRTWAWFSTDSRKKLVGRFWTDYEWGDYGFRKNWEIGMGVNYRPFSAFELSMDPELNSIYEDARYVETIESEEENRYIMGSLQRKIAVLNLRINLYITPDLSIQFWGQPFFFSGDYSNFKLVTDPMHSDYFQQFHLFTEDQLWYDEKSNLYKVCKAGFNDPANGCSTDNPDYQFENPDFSVYEFRSNMVLRWEYIPGSFLYFVWSQDRVGDNTEGTFYFDQQLNGLLDSQSVNVFLVKFSYRFSF